MTVRLRFILSKHHGHFAACGSVTYLFRAKGQTAIQRPLADEASSHDLALAVGVAMPQARGRTAEPQKQTPLSHPVVAVAGRHLTAQVLHFAEVPDVGHTQDAYFHSELSKDLPARVSA